MIQDRKSKKGAAAGLIFAAVVLVLVVLLENLSSLLPSVPAVLQPTSQLFTVLKKGAVYSLVAVSMNLLNGFTGLFSLGQAGFMLLGAYTYAILTVPMSAKDTVYYLFGGSAVPFSLPDLFGGVDSPVGLILGVVLAILLGVLVFSSVKIISYMMEKKESEKNQQDLIDQVVTPVTPSNDNTDGNTDSSTGSEPDYISVDFAALQAKYPDVVGWIYGANTGINYPIVQTAEEGGEYYLYRDIDGSSKKNGTIFLDWRCNSDFTTQNNLLYGHNMKSGRMFAAITKYKEQSFYDAHPYLYLYTPNQLYKVNLFAGMVTPHDSDVYAYELSSDYIKQCISSSTFTSTTGTPTGNILTLSTCDYVYDNARYVVMGEMVPIDWPS